MNMRIVEADVSTFLVVDPTETPAVIDAYPTRAEAENFLVFIGAMPMPEVSENLNQVL